MINAITTRSRVQLPGITGKRLVIKTNKVHTTDEGQVDEYEELTKENLKENLDNPQVKTTILVIEYVPTILFPQMLKKHKLDQ